MKRLTALTIATFTAFTIAATSLSAPAQAGKRERGIAAGVLLGALGGALIAGEIHRKRKKRHYRNNHRQQRQHRYERADRGFYYDEYNEPVRVRRHRNRDTRRISRWQRHVNRCYDRYKTYDERSDSFIGFDGREHQCRL